MFSKRIRKSIAVCLLLLMVNSTVAPTISYALTAGPTAPEATSFEPVDTTDLVDLKSGDFTYNLPLLEVPGPAGGYPISLSYHAGISPDQEASWAGLGWTLNPGSISRLVNGYPDDHLNVSNVDRVFWEGGATTTTSVGVSYGFANVASVSANLTFSQDTYRGRGVGYGFGGGIGFGGGKDSPYSFGAFFDASTGPYGETGFSLGVQAGVGNGAGRVSASASINYNSSSGYSFGGGVGVSAAGQSLVGASISSNSSKPSFSVAGSSMGVYNGKSGNVSYETDAFSFEIPVWYGINVRLGRSYQRYWIDESADIGTYGSLYLPRVNPDFAHAFDAYDVPDPGVDVVDHHNPETVLGGSFPDYDVYTVTGQGVGGNMRPHIYQKHLFRQDKKNQTNNQILVKSYLLEEEEVAKEIEFRFVNDFSNRLEYNAGEIDTDGANISYQFENTLVTGKTGEDGFVNNNLAGSKNVRWFSNRHILGADQSKKPFEQGFLDTNSEGFTRLNDDQVGGYSVTNSNGITYHYALPAYSYGEYMKSQKYDEKGKLNFNALSKPEKYAYTWFLTTVTGPDYVDRNNNKIADEGDWGYWVNFTYKQWLSDYQWRNPGEGMHKDIDTEFDFYSSGKKELYYLEKITTASHVAVFEKSVRDDGREVLSLTGGGFEPIPIPDCVTECTNRCDEAFCFQGTCQEPAFTNCQNACQVDCPDDEEPGYIFPRATLKLERVQLFNYKDFKAGKTTDDYSLRTISLEHDYSLARNTPNSYNEDAFSVPSGKLTLKAVHFSGKKNISLVPPMRFDYARNPDYKKEASDLWGFYKDDFEDKGQQNLKRLVTPASAAMVDAWSLTGITTSLGATISVKYESDTYKESVLSRYNIIDSNKFRFNSTNNSVVIKPELHGTDLTKFESVLLGSDFEMLVGKPFEFNEECVCDRIFIPLGAGEAGNFYKRHPVVITSTNLLNVWSDSLEIAIPEIFEGIVQQFDDTYKESPCTDRSETTTIIPAITVKKGRPVAGVLYLKTGSEYPGGGLRVTEISMYDQVQKDTLSTVYEYEDGVTSYLPTLTKVEYDFARFESNRWKAEYIRIHKARKEFYGHFSDILAISRIIPGPGVMYKKVRVKERRSDASGLNEFRPSYSTFEFETFTEDMVKVERPDVKIEDVTGTYESINYKRVATRSLSIKDYTTRIGSLKSITLSNLDGTPVSKTINHYLEDDKANFETKLSENFSNQGVVAETFTRAKLVRHNAGKSFLPYDYKTFFTDQYNLLGLVNQRKTYPSVQTGQTQINYKTGITTTTETKAFDFYSGEATMTVTTDSYDNRFMTVVEPAYHRYPGMGLAIYGGANMLSQVTATSSFKINDELDSLGLLSASIQTWSDGIPMRTPDGSQSKIWRKQSAYQWNGQEALAADGTYPIDDFKTHKYVWGSSTNSSWEKTGEITLSNIYSDALEASDLNNRYAATRMDPSDERVIASVGNSRYGEMAFTGAEYYNGNSLSDGGVSRGEGNPSSTRAHTGKYSLLVGYNSKGFQYTLRSSEANVHKKYRASVWVYVPGDSETQPELDKVELYYSVNDVVKKAQHPVLQKNKAKSWYLINLDIMPSEGDITIGCRNNASRSVYFDDFRVHPLDAAMTSYVYDPFSGELTYMLDANNLYLKFEYDAAGRLTRKSKELLNFDFGPDKESFKADRILQDVEYNYAKPTGN
jgi:hypothetical protein